MVQDMVESQSGISERHWDHKTDKRAIEVQQRLVLKVQWLTFVLISALFYRSHYSTVLKRK